MSKNVSDYSVKIEIIALKHQFIILKDKIKIIHAVHNEVCAKSFIVPLVEFFDQVGFETYLWVSQSKKYRGILDQYKIRKRNIELGFTLNLFSFIKRLLTVYHALKQEKPDIVHAHITFGATICLLAAYLAKVPIRIYQCHGFAYFGYSGFLRWALIYLEKINIFLATDVLTVSRSNLEQIRSDQLLFEKRAYCPGYGSVAGLDFDQFNLSAVDSKKLRRELEIPEDAFVLAYVGRPVKRKGFYDLLQAWDKIVDSNSYLIIAGCSLNDCKDVTRNVKAFSYYHEMPNFYAAADLVVLPSYHEGFGYALLEAAASGKAAIGSDIPGIRCAIEHGKSGILVEAGNVEALVNKIKFLKDNKNLRLELGASARERAQRLFSRDFVMQENLKIYQEILKTSALISNENKLMAKRH